MWGMMEVVSGIENKTKGLMKPTGSPIFYPNPPYSQLRLCIAAAVFY